MNDYGLASPPYQEKSQSVFLLLPLSYPSAGSATSGGEEGRGAWRDDIPPIHTSTIKPCRL